jgi:hypothetical protein
MNKITIEIELRFSIDNKNVEPDLLPAAERADSLVSTLG